MSNLPRPTTVDFVPNPKPFAAPSQRTRFRQWLRDNGHDATRLSGVEVDYLIVVFLEHERAFAVTKTIVNASTKAIWNGRGEIEVQG